MRCYGGSVSAMPETESKNTDSCQEIKDGIDELDDRLVAAFGKDITDDKYTTLNLALRGLRPLTETADGGCAAAASVYFDSVKRTIDAELLAK